ncbi:MAG TPA: DUF1552 domain-containing protein [Phycisphaerae bacterium]|jgi:hypothetical protein
MRKVKSARFHRRTFLKGIGAAIALPLLDAMVPGSLRSAFAAESIAAPAAKAATRLGFIYVPNGIVMQNWTPAKAGAEFEITRILKPLESYRDKTLVISRLMSHNANALGDGGGDHARAGAAFLTGAHPKKTGGSDIYNGVSVDQALAAEIGGQTRLPSLEVSLDDTRTIGHCDSGYSCAYTNSLSWKSPTTPNPPEASPRLLFERLFGDVDTSIDAETRARRAKYRQSILDMTRDETARLVNDLGANDKRKMDEYLTTIREVEKRVQRVEQDDRQIVPSIDKPAGIPSSFTEYAKLMYDLQALALQADVTRIITLVVGREGSVRTYEEIGIPDPHHPLSHHQNRPEALEKLTQINTHHMELFAYFVGKLASTREGDGSLLDHTMLMYGCGLSDSNRHIPENLPILVVGGGNGQVDGGRHIMLQNDTPVANLFLSLMDRMGAHPKSFGDSTGRLDIG